MCRTIAGASPEVGAATRRLANQGRSGSAIRTYGSDWANFEAWCERKNRVTLSAHSVTVAKYLRVQHEAGLAVSIIARRLCTIRLKYIAGAAPSPHAEFLVLEVMKCPK